MPVFILILASTVLLIPAIFIAPGHPVSGFYHSGWFWAFGGIVAVAGLNGCIKGLIRRNWTSFVGHLGIVLLSIGVLRDTRATEGFVTVKQGETATTFVQDTTERPLGFALTLASFEEQGYRSQVQLDNGRLRTVAPSRPVSYQGWLILQEAYDRTEEPSRVTLVTDSGDTIRIQTRERFMVPNAGFEMEFENDVAADTTLRFRLYQNGIEKASGFISRRGIRPPTLKLGFKLAAFESGARPVSILRVTRRPGAGLVFFSFLVILAGVGLALRRNPEGLN